MKRIRIPFSSESKSLTCYQATCEVDPSRVYGGSARTHCTAVPDPLYL